MTPTRWLALMSALVVAVFVGSPQSSSADDTEGCRVSGQLSNLAEHLLEINANGARIGIGREVFEDNTITNKDNQSVDCELEGTFAFPEPVSPGRWLIRIDATYIVDPQAERQTISSLLYKTRIDIADDEAARVLELPPAWSSPETTAEHVHQILDSERPNTNTFESWSYWDVQIAQLDLLEDREGVVSELDRILQDEASPPFWAYTASDALARMQPVTTSQLTAIERALSGPYTRWAIGAVERLGGDALPLLDGITALRDHEDPAIRDAAIRAIGTIATATEEDVAGTIEALIGGLSDEDARVRMDAADFLGRLGPRAAAAVPALEERLTDSDGPTRVWSAHALFKIDGQVDRPLGVLIEILEGEDVDATWHAALAIASFGADAKPAVPALEQLQGFLGEPPFNNYEQVQRYQNRRNALRALQQIDPETAAKYGDL